MTISKFQRCQGSVGENHLRSVNLIQEICYFCLSNYKKPHLISHNTYNHKYLRLKDYPLNPHDASKHQFPSLKNDLIPYT